MEVMERTRKPHQGRNVEFTRRLKGKSQYDLADAMQVEQPTISGWEKKEMIDPERLQQIAKALEVDVKFLEEFIPEDYMDISRIMNTFNNKDFQKGSTSGNVYEGAEVDYNENQIEYAHEIKNNNFPESIIKDYIEEIKLLNKKVTDLKVFIAKNGLEYKEEVE